MARPLLNQSAALVGQLDDMLVKFHLSETNGLCQARTWTTRLTDGDADHYAISLGPQEDAGIDRKTNNFLI